MYLRSYSICHLLPTIKPVHVIAIFYHIIHIHVLHGGHMYITFYMRIMCTSHVCHMYIHVYCMFVTCAVGVGVLIQY